MIKKIYLVRHAEAKAYSPGEKDVDRPLTSKGMQEASRLGALLYNSKASLAAIYCSTALRSQQTAELIGDQMRIDSDKLVTHKDLYEASVRIYAELIRSFSESWNEVMIIGHNPVILYFAEYISGQSIEGGLKTCTLVELQFAVDEWMNAPEKGGKILRIIKDGEEMEI